MTFYKWRLQRKEKLMRRVYFTKRNGLTKKKKVDAEFKRKVDAIFPREMDT